MSPSESGPEQRVSLKRRMITIGTFTRPAGSFGVMNGSLNVKSR